MQGAPSAPPDDPRERDRPIWRVHPREGPKLAERRVRPTFLFLLWKNKSDLFISSYFVSILMGADLSNILKIQRLSDDHIQVCWVYENPQSILKSSTIIIRFELKY